MVWQGFISFQCDVVDLGIPSWSHPADRISATLFIFQQSCKYAFMRCGGEWGRALKAFMVLSWISGLWAFKRSGLACRERKLREYRFWHVTWHIAFPVLQISFYLAQFLAPADAVRCRCLGLPWAKDEL